MATKKGVSVKKTAPKKKGFIAKNIVALGTGVAALGAATYYLFGPNGTKHQKDLKTLAHTIKDDVAKRVKKTEKLSEKTYHAIVDEVAKSYEKYGKKEVSIVAKKLKSQWKGAAKTAEKSVKPVVKQAVKKVTTLKKVIKKK